MKTRHFSRSAVILSTIIYMTPIPCRRKSVKRKKMRKHQKHRHPRRMTAIQRCPPNRFSWEYSVSLKLLGRLQSDIPNSINKRLSFKSNILPRRIMMVSLGFFLIYGLLIWFFFLMAQPSSLCHSFIKPNMEMQPSAILKSWHVSLLFRFPSGFFPHIISSWYVLVLVDFSHAADGLERITESISLNFTHVAWEWRRASKSLCFTSLGYSSLAVRLSV